MKQVEIVRLPWYVRKLWVVLPSGIVLGCLLALWVTTTLPAAAQTRPATKAHFLVPQTFVFPVMGTRRSSGYGMRLHPIRKFSRLHQGVDLAAPEGSYIRAVEAGVVVFADPYAGYGNLVVIRHANRMTTHYGHCQKLKVHPGQRVRAGEVIATVGNTGHSTGPHLHLEIRFDGKSIDPERYMPDLAGDAEG